MLTVSEIMTANVFTEEADASAEEAAWGLTRRHNGGAPVRDSRGNVVGVLSKGDLVNPEPSQWIRGEATVGDLMTPDVRAVHAEDPARRRRRDGPAKRPPRRRRRRGAEE